MTPPKISTFQEKLGFTDPDFKSQKHDEIMFWLDKNIQAICQFLVSPSATINTAKWYLKEMENEFGRYHEIDSTEKKALEILENSIPEVEVSVEIESKKWEVPVLSRDYTVGFIDFVAEGFYRVPAINFKTHIWEISKSNVKFAFEAKTLISSIGEVVRQINTYKTYVKDCQFVIVAPDPTFSKTFREQRINFITHLPNYSGLQLTEMLNQLRDAEAA